MIDKSKFRFRIGDTVEFRGANHKVKGYYFSGSFGDYSSAYGYTIDYPHHGGGSHSYDECGNPMKFAKDSVFYARECKVEAVAKCSTNRRTLEITLEQATQWYNSGNSDLKALALSVYFRDELEMNYQGIRNGMSVNSVCLEIPCSNREELALKVYTKLRVLAYAFNAGWTMKAGSVGFFISKDEYIPNTNFANATLLSRKYNHRIANHNTVMQAGIVYFKNEGDVVKAYRMLGEEEVEQLFK